MPPRNFSTAIGLFDAHLRQAIAERVAGEAEESGGVALVAVGSLQGFTNERLLVIVERHSVGQKIVAGCRRGAGAVGSVDTDIARLYARALRQQDTPLDHVFELAHIAGPVVAHEPLQRALAEVSPEFFGE